MFRRAILFAFIVVGLWACEKGNDLPQKPQLWLDRDSFDGGVEFGAVFIGTQPIETLMIQNQGLEDLIISGVSKGGDSAFTITEPSELQVKGLERSYVQIVFSPTSEKAYSGTLTINSNAENTPSRVVNLSGRGVKADADAGM